MHELSVMSTMVAMSRLKAVKLMASLQTLAKTLTTNAS
jgi:hypothetical protein